MRTVLTPVGLRMGFFRVGTCLNLILSTDWLPLSQGWLTPHLSLFVLQRGSGVVVISLYDGNDLVLNQDPTDSHFEMLYICHFRNWIRQDAR